MYINVHMSLLADRPAVLVAGGLGPSEQEQMPFSCGVGDGAPGASSSSSNHITGTLYTYIDR